MELGRVLFRRRMVVLFRRVLGQLFCLPMTSFSGIEIIVLACMAIFWPNLCSCAISIAAIPTLVARTQLNAMGDPPIRIFFSEIF